MSGSPSVPSEIVCFLLVIVVVGLSITYGLSRSTHVTLPYTVFMFLFGIIVSVANSFSNSGGGGNLFLQLSIEQWEQIHPDVISYAFLPPLLFAEAFSLNVHQMRKVFFPSLLVAIPGAAFAAFCQGEVVYWLLPSNSWSWTLCLTIGSILCAVDPISVVATLKTVVGNVASTQKLIYFITGEALMSDASAIIIYGALVNSIDSPSQVFPYIAKVMLISPLIGLGFGLCTVLLLKFVNRRMRAEDNILQVVLTVLCAYSSFFAARFALSVSGVVSCCTSGVVISWLATPLILNQASVTVVWQIMRWFANTVIFTVAGMVVANRAFATISLADIEAIFIVYLAILVIRFVMLLLCYPFIKKFFWSEFSMRELMFSCFAGLRGAVSLTLMLSLLKRIDPSTSTSSIVKNVSGYIFSESDIHRAVFIICGVVFLNIVVNGSLTVYVIHGLRLSSPELSADEQMILYYIKKRLRRKSHVLLERLHRTLPAHDSAFVMRLCTLMHARTVDFITTQQQDGEEAGRLLRGDAPRGDGDGDGRVGARSDEPLLDAMARSSEDERVLRLRAEDSSDNEDRVSSLTEPSRHERSDSDIEGQGNDHADVDEDDEDGDQTDNEDHDHEFVLLPGRTHSFSVPHDSPLKGASWAAAVNNGAGSHGTSWAAGGGGVIGAALTRRRKKSREHLEEDEGATPVKSAGLAATSDYWTPTKALDHRLCFDSNSGNPGNPSDSFDYSYEHDRDYSHNDFMAAGGGGGGLGVGGANGNDSKSTTDSKAIAGGGAIGAKTRMGDGGVGPLQTAMQSMDQLLITDTDIDHHHYSHQPPATAPQTLPVFGGRRRLASDAVDTMLIAKFRRIFLEVARRSYLRQIREGRIPRGSLAALTLLESIDVGHDTCHTPGLQDWDFINRGLREPFYITILRKSCELGRSVLDRRVSSLLGCDSTLQWIEDHATADKMTITTSFIEAHRFAQHQIPYYLGEEEWAESPEEFLILEESRNNAASAKRVLSEIPRDELKLHVSRQAARMVLCMQEDMLIYYIKEGILLPDNATSFLTEIRTATEMLHKVNSLE